jgi:hypothetical protein
MHGILPNENLIRFLVRRCIDDTYVPTNNIVKLKNKLEEAGATVELK